MLRPTDRSILSTLASKPSIYFWITSSCLKNYLMRHQNKGKIFGREKAPREAMLRNLVQSVILYERVNTTLPKAKVVRSMVEKLITTGRKKTLVSRRALSRVLTIESAVNKVLEELGPRYAERKGGYTRIIKLGRRVGDGADIAQLQLIKE